MTVNRFCASGLQAIAQAAERIASGQATAILAGGTESMSLVPMGGYKVAPNPTLVERYPDVYLTTGLVAENHARELSISRERRMPSRFGATSARSPPMDAGRFDDEIVPIATSRRRRREREPADRARVDVRVDEGPRRDTSMEALAKLRPAFHAHGTVTAGNSSQMSDGAAAVLVMSAARAT